MVLGGLAFAVVSVIPIIGWLWFIWSILGGLLAVFLYKTWKEGDPATTKESVLLGLGSGVIGGVIMFVLSIIMAFLVAFIMTWMNRPNLKFMKAVGETFEFLLEKSFPMILIQIAISFVAAVLVIGFATLGGYLGWLFFVKPTLSNPVNAGSDSPNLKTVSPVN